MKIIEMDIQCQSCGGTGLYQGIGEGNGIAVVCRTCSGTGKQHYRFEYEPYTGRKERGDVQRVYRSTYGYRLGTGVIDVKGFGELDMSREGVSYEEFLAGEEPGHIKSLACPMTADQAACNNIDGFVERCMAMNGGWIGYLPSCKFYPSRAACWKRFEEAHNG